MTFEELTPEAITVLKSLVNKPHAMDDSPLLQLLLAEGLAMGSTKKVHITGQGGRLLAAKIAAASLD